jgi:hypothetical protein
MPLTPSPIQLRGERGFSMFLVVVGMLVTAMFVAAGFAAANGDLRLSVESKERKVAYAAAEAGLGFYLKELRENPDVWTQCDQVSAPNVDEENPINQQWNGGAPEDDPRRWRKIPGVSAEYTIELLHRPGYTACGEDQASIVDMSNGTFKIRVTGRAAEDRRTKRSIVVTFRREGFLKFVYFTVYENTDPQALPSASARAAAQLNCADRYRSARDPDYCGAIEIQFPTGDAINGPLHTNDENLSICGSPKFGREKYKDGSDAGNDTIEVSGPAPGHQRHNSGCGNTPQIFTPTGKFTPEVEQLDLPPDNQELVNVADNGGRLYSGKTIVRLKRTVMDVTNFAPNGTATTSLNVAWPSNGVLYVKNNGVCNGEIPTEARYVESAACGNVYVSGEYSKPLTIAAANDVIVRPTAGATLLNGSTDGDIKKVDDSDATLGLIANNFVRVGHKVTRSGSSCVGNYSSSDEPTIRDVRIDAAIMSLLHSFMVDNYNCGRLETLTVNGAIVQKYRGPVGTGSGGSHSTGFLKDYWYDDRLRYRSPPYFLNPLKASWAVGDSHEQVPAR